MKKGEIYEGVIEKIDFQNKGRVKIKDTTVTVKNGIPGQKVRFMINKKRGGRVEGRLLEVLEKSELEKRDPLCSIFPSCGGCMYGDGLQESSEDITSDRGTGSAARRGRGVWQKAERSRKRRAAVPHRGRISRIFCAWNPVLACAGEFYVYQPVPGAVENRIGQVFGMTVERKKQQMTCLYQ